MADASNDISVIIVSWNVVDALRRCLTSVMQQTEVRFEVFVVDNASNDGSAQMVRESFPHVQLTANVQNVGFATANNQALKSSNGRHVLLLNPDTELPEGVLAKTVQFLDGHADVGVLGCRIVHDDGKLQRSVLRFPTFLSQALVLLKVQAFTLKPKVLQQYYALDFDYDKEADVDQVMGAFFAMQGNALRELGPLDGKFFAWFEEVDYCKQAVNKGWKVHYTPSFFIKHSGGQSFRQLFSIEQQLIFNRSMLHYFRKNHNAVAVVFLFVLTLPSIVFSTAEQIVQRWYVPKSVR